MIDQTIIDLYKVFGRYPVNRGMEGSPLYGAKVKEWNAELLSKPLSQLNSEVLARFCSSVTLTWGSIDDYKHFLPRIYELINRIDFIAEIWVVFDVLNKYDWYNWPNEEVSLLNRYFVDLWESVICNSNEATDYAVANYLSSISNVYLDFNELLAMWQSNESMPSVRKLAYYLSDNYEEIFIKVRLPGFHPSKERGEKLLEWLISPEMKTLLRKHRITYEGEDFEISLGWMVDTIDVYQ